MARASDPRAIQPSPHNCLHIRLTSLFLPRRVSPSPSVQVAGILKWSKITCNPRGQQKGTPSSACQCACIPPPLYAALVPPVKGIPRWVDF
ncbi:hypothetical protein E2C01_001694 [Portunus trituberculatus]|uniref:Uncharacterized protein n=1 Tax=Portunus trituberculatus TaxID=210409 RepID=A0A5B7CJX7_PORTR|nr:hypothetical protein [Portunus trituberculatus]